jgi:hypothetical protein
MNERLQAKVQTALQLAVEYTNSEHHAGRCALMLALLIFSLDEWNIVPQFYTHTRKWPDFAFERFYYRPGKWREVLFIANVFMEFKINDSPDDPIEQLKKAIIMQYGTFSRSKGVLIGVKGVKWRFVDYHFVTVPNQREPQLLTKDFTDGPMGETVRPTPSRKYNEGEYMDLKSEKEGKDVIQALLWIAKGKQGRDLSFMKRHTSALPQSFTRSTLDNGILVDTEQDQHILGSEFEYLIPLLEEEVRGGYDIREAEQDEAGGQSQGSGRMEVE